MDATYKTTRYAIPLYFVCVHTKVGYKVVAEFICQSEDLFDVHIFCSIIGEIPRSVRFAKTTMERIGLGAIAVARFSMQVVWMCLSWRRLRNISPALRVASCRYK